MRPVPSVCRALPRLGVLVAALALSGCGATRSALTPTSLAALRIPLPDAMAEAPIATPAPAAVRGAIAPATFEAPAPPLDADAPDVDVSVVQRGVASYYASSFHGRTTASGELYDETELSAAHRTLPFGSRVRVTNLANDRYLVLTVTDRGPFVRGRVIDVSREAARRLGFLDRGTIPVEITVIDR